jgi:CheY-like chemotaxis protein
MGDDIFSNRLLVVDDDPGAGLLIKRVAEGLGFDVVAPEDPHALQHGLGTLQSSS